MKVIKVVTILLISILSINCGNIVDPVHDYKYIHSTQLAPQSGPIEIDHKAQVCTIEFRNQPRLSIVLGDNYAKRYFDTLNVELEYPDMYSYDWLTINYTEDPLKLTLTFTENSTNYHRFVDIECHAPTRATESREYAIVIQSPKCDDQPMGE